MGETCQKGHLGGPPSIMTKAHAKNMKRNQRRARQRSENGGVTKPAETAPIQALQEEVKRLEEILDHIKGISNHFKDAYIDETRLSDTFRDAMQLSEEASAYFYKLAEELEYLCVNNNLRVEMEAARQLARAHAAEKSKVRARLNEIALADRSDKFAATMERAHKHLS